MSAAGEEHLQGPLSKVILEINQSSGPGDILQIRLGREQEAPAGGWEVGGILHIVLAWGELLSYCGCNI